MSQLPDSVRQRLEAEASDYTSKHSGWRDCSICNGREQGLEHGYIEDAAREDLPTILKDDPEHIEAQYCEAGFKALNKLRTAISELES